MKKSRKIPPAPPTPPLPSPAQSRQAESDFVKRFPARGPKALSNQLKANFERDDARWKPVGPHPSAIICEGDSWFNHPMLYDIPEALSIFGYNVLHSNYPGKLLQASADAKAPSFEPLRDSRRKWIKALVLSGGGNDLISWKPNAQGVSAIFRKATSNDPLDYFDQAELKAAFKTLASYHKKIAKQLEALAKKGAPRVPVFLHCYDYIKPKKYPAPLLKGYWIEKQLAITAAGKDAAFHALIAKELIKRWVASYQATCAELKWTFVPTQNIVKNRWYDEIHPHSTAFHEIALAFRKALIAAGIPPL